MNKYVTHEFSRSRRLARKATIIETAWQVGILVTGYVLLVLISVV